MLSLSKVLEFPAPGSDEFAALHSSKAALLRESQRAADLEAAIEGARRPSEGRSEETKAAAEATPADRLAAKEKELDLPPLPDIPDDVPPDTDDV